MTHTLWSYFILCYYQKCWLLVQFSETTWRIWNYLWMMIVEKTCYKLYGGLSICLSTIFFLQKYLFILLLWLFFFQKKDIWNSWWSYRFLVKTISLWFWLNLIVAWLFSLFGVVIKCWETWKVPLELFSIWIIIMPSISKLN